MKKLKKIILNLIVKYYKDELDLIYNVNVDTKRQPSIESKKVDIEIVQREAIIRLDEIDKIHIRKERVGMLKDSIVNDFLKSLAPYLDTQVIQENDKEFIIKIKIGVWKPI